MNKISSALIEIIQNNDFLAFGLKNKLLNLTQTAAYLKPFIKERTKKDVRESAILMSLSRLNKSKLPSEKAKKGDMDSLIINFSIMTNLCALTYYNNSAFRSQLNNLYAGLKGHKGYFTHGQGINEFSIIVDPSFLSLIRKYIKEKPKNIKDKLISFNIQMKEEYYNQSGIIAKLLDRIAFQGINIYEISSTYSEIIFYVDEADMKLTFDTLCSISNGSY